MFARFKPWHQSGYGRLQRSSSRSSSEDGSSAAEENLLSKEIPLDRDYKNSPPWWRRNLVLLVSHALLFSLYSGILWIVAHNVRIQLLKGPQLLTTPANDVVLYEERGLILESRIQDSGRFAAKPSPEVDNAWHDLLNDINIEVEPEIMRHFGREDIGIRLPDREGYVGTLNVYHQLHCIKRLHQYMYADHYYPDFTPAQKEMNRLHSEHCIDFLRQSIMCLGDVGLITFEWSPDNLIPVANATTHQCINWEMLDSWTKARAVDMYKKDYLIHPQFGPAYPSENKVDRLGVADPKSPYVPEESKGSEYNPH